MKQLNITIHPFSALAGMALLGLVWVTAGAMPLQGSSSTRDVSAIGNVNEPHPRDFVRVVGGTPFVVPPGRVLVVRSLASSTPASTQYNYIWITGINTYVGKLLYGDHHDVHPGVMAVSGDSVTVYRNGFDGLALGYLVDA